MKFLIKLFSYNFLTKLKNIYRNLRYLIIVLVNPKKYFKLTTSQHNLEKTSLDDLSGIIKNKNFIEIGFHYKQLNCVGLIEKNFTGKLIDCSTLNSSTKFTGSINIFMMKLLMKINNKKVKIIDKFLHLENLDEILENNMGVFSIDIDGNEYWFLSHMLEKKKIPDVIVTEYNASFLNHSITVPYEKNFNIRDKYKFHIYHGASLVALNNLLENHGYSLIKVIGGVNAIFIKSEYLKKSNLQKLDPIKSYQECPSRNIKYNINAKEQYDLIKHLPVVKV